MNLEYRLAASVNVSYVAVLRYCMSYHNTGPVGVAAAAAIVSAKKRKRPHSFETNPSIRKRQQNRLLRKLRVSRSDLCNVLLLQGHGLCLYCVHFCLFCN
jgi:hypothetical protein